MNYIRRDWQALSRSTSDRRPIGGYVLIAYSSSAKSVFTNFGLADDNYILTRIMIDDKIVRAPIAPTAQCIFRESASMPVNSAPTA